MNDLFILEAVKERSGAVLELSGLKPSSQNNERILVFAVSGT